MASGYNYQPLQQNEPVNSYFQPRKTDPATPSPAYVTAPGSPGVLEMAAPGGHGVPPSSSSVSAEPVQKIALSKEESKSFQEDSKKAASASKEKLAPLKQHQHDFNSMDKKYRCCCGSMNVKKGVLAIAIFQLVIVILQLGIHVAACVLGYAKDYDNLPYEIFLNAAISGTIIVFLIPLFIGLRFENGSFFVPWQFMSMLEIVFFIFVGFCTIFHFYHIDEKKFAHWATLLGVIALVILLIGVMIWWNFVINKCKKYFADKKKYRPMELAEI